MSRLAIPARDDVPEASKPILDAVHKQLGVVPNMFRLIAQSPATLQGFTSNNAAFRGSFDLSSSLKATAHADYFDNDQTLQTRLSRNAQHTWNYGGSLEQSFSQRAALILTAFGSDSSFTTDNTGGFDGVHGRTIEGFK